MLIQAMLCILWIFGAVALSFLVIGAVLVFCAVLLTMFKSIVDVVMDKLSVEKW